MGAHHQNASVQYAWAGYPGNAHVMHVHLAGHSALMQHVMHCSPSRRAQCRTVEISICLNASSCPHLCRVSCQNPVPKPTTTQIRGPWRMFCGVLMNNPHTTSITASTTRSTLQRGQPSNSLVPKHRGSHFCTEIGCKSVETQFPVQLVLPPAPRHGLCTHAVGSSTTGNCSIRP